MGSAVVYIASAVLNMGSAGVNMAGAVLNMGSAVVYIASAVLNMPSAGLYMGSAGFFVKGFCGSPFVLAFDEADAADLFVFFTVGPED